MSRKAEVITYFMLFNVVIFGTHLLIIFFRPDIETISKIGSVNLADHLISDDMNVDKNPYEFHVFYLLWNSFVAILHGFIFVMTKMVWQEFSRKLALILVCYAVGMSLFKVGFGLSFMANWEYSSFSLLMIYLTGIVPHGMFEIPAISLVMTFGVMNFKSFRSGADRFSLKEEIKGLFTSPIFQTVLILLSIAAPIEAYITPHCLDLLLDFYGV